VNGKEESKYTFSRFYEAEPVESSRRKHFEITSKMGETEESIAKRSKLMAELAQ